MRSRIMSRLTDRARFRRQAALARLEREKDAVFLACLGDMDARESHLLMGYPTTYHLCVEHFQMDEDDASSHVQAARAAHRFPAILAAVADGRLRINCVGLMAPYLTPENAGELLAAAEHKTVKEVETVLVGRIEQVKFASRALILTEAPGAAVRPSAARPMVTHATRRAPEPAAPVAGPPATDPDEEDEPTSQIIELAPDEVGLSVVITRETRSRLRRARDFLGHETLSEAAAELLVGALDTLLEELG
jgi:hypothetical protein